MDRDLRDRISDFPWITIISVVALAVLLSGLLLWVSKSLTPGTAISIIGVLISLVAVAASHIRFEKQLAESRLERKRDRMEALLEEVERGIENCQTNVARIQGKEGGLGYSEQNPERGWCKLTPILEWDELDPDHREYLQENYPEIPESLDQWSHEPKFMVEERAVEASRILREFVDKQTSSEELFQYCTESLVNQQDPSVTKMREIVGTERGPPPIQTGQTLETHPDGETIFPYTPHPEEWREYLELLDELEDYYESVENMLRGVKADLQRKGYSSE